MNEDIATGKCIFTQYQFFNPVYYTAGTKIDYVSKFAEKSVILKLEEITKEEAIELFDASNSHNITGNVGNIVLEDFYGYKYLVDFKYLLTVSMRAQQKTTTDSFDVFSIDIQNVNDGVSLVYRSNDFERFSIDNLKKFYKIVKHVKDETYVWLRNRMDTNKYLELSDRTCKHIAAEGVVILPEMYDLLHATLGISGESGELLDAVKKSFIYNKPLDIVNAKEELGDLLWYIALACRTLNVSFEELMQMNIDKLTKRYPEKYTDEHASARLDKI